MSRQSRYIVYSRNGREKSQTGSNRRSPSPENKEQSGVYFAERGEAFTTFIRKLLAGSKLKSKYIKLLTDKEGMKLYASAFTSELVDEDNNYQVFEQLGDLLGNKFIVCYMYKRFPQLHCTDGVKVVARLRINYGAKESFSKIANELGFWPWISATNDLRQRKMKSLLEDVFEAFLGVTEFILDNKIRNGIGYAIAYDLLKHIFDKMPISLRYEDLYDPKTRLKELFDMHEERLGPLVYKGTRNDDTGITTSTAYRVDGGSYEVRPNGSVNRKRIVGGKYVKIGTGSASLKADAQQNASASALRFLNQQGWYKPVPKVYRMFNEGVSEEMSKITPERIKEEWKQLDAVTGEYKFDINEQRSTRDKTKYQSKYTSTLLGMYCRKRMFDGVESCLKLGADPNIPDSDGLYPMDSLLVGETDHKTVSRILQLFRTPGRQKLSVTTGVVQRYGRYYRSEDFVGEQGLFKMLKMLKISGDKE